MNRIHETTKRYFPANPPDAPPADKRALVVLGASTVLLTLFHYYGRTRFYREHRNDWGFDALFPDWMHGIVPYGWWGMSSLLFRVLIPCAIIFLWLKEKPSDWGLSFKGQLKQGKPYLAMFAFMLPILYLVSLTPGFQKTYPFYKPAMQGGAVYWTYTLFYVLQFLGVEFFFRGFMTFGLFKRLGYYSLWIMCIPYVMIHFGKPMSETLGALVAGLLLGAMALKSRSIWWGVALHCGVAITMDFLSMWQRFEGSFSDFVSKLFFGA